jgi:hypothetical protein
MNVFLLNRALRNCFHNPLKKQISFDGLLETGVALGQRNDPGRVGSTGISMVIKPNAWQKSTKVGSPVGALSADQQTPNSVIS